MNSAGFSNISTNLETGVITIDGFQFKPDYFLTPLSSEDSVYLTLNGIQGVAFRATDANDDGRTDYEVITESGVQVFYSLQ